MFQQVVGVSVFGAPYPARFVDESLALGLPDGWHQFQKLGSAQLVLEEGYRGWAVRGQRRLLPDSTVDVLVNSHEFLFINVGKRFLSSLVPKVFCFVRISELKGWKRAGPRGAAVFALGLSELGTNELEKVRIRVKARDGEALQRLIAVCPEVADPQTLDEEVRPLLPHAPALGLTHRATVAPILFGLVAFFAALVVALLQRPGSAGAVLALQVGGLLLASSIPATLLSIFLQRRAAVAVPQRDTGNKDLVRLGTFWALCLAAPLLMALGTWAPAPEMRILGPVGIVWLGTVAFSYRVWRIAKGAAALQNAIRARMRDARSRP